MSVGISQAWRQNFLNYIFRATALPTLPNGLQIALHTGQPASGRSNEASGGNYSPVSIATGALASTFAAATAANPSVSANSAVISFPTANSTGYSAGAAMLFWAAWHGASTTDLICYGSIPSQIVPAGATPSFAISQLFTQLSET